MLLDIAAVVDMVTVMADNPPSGRDLQRPPAVASVDSSPDARLASPREVAVRASALQVGAGRPARSICV